MITTPESGKVIVMSPWSEVGWVLVTPEAFTTVTLVFGEIRTFIAAGMLPVPMNCSFHFAVVRTPRHQFMFVEVPRNTI